MGTVKEQITTERWYAVTNGAWVDIHVRIFPEGESPRELTVMSDLPSHEAAAAICDSHNNLS